MGFYKRKHEIMIKHIEDESLIPATE